MNKVSLPAFKQNLVNLKNNWSHNKFDPSFYFKFLVVVTFSPLLIAVSLVDDLEAKSAKTSIFKKALLENSLKKIQNTDTVYFNDSPIVNNMALDGKSQTAGLHIMLLPNEDTYLFKKNESTSQFSIKKINLYDIDKEEHGYSILLSYLLKNQTTKKVSHVVNYLNTNFTHHNSNPAIIEQIKETLLITDEKQKLEKSLNTSLSLNEIKPKKKSKI